MISLLDVNVLIALVDSAHVHHDAAKRAFRSFRTAGWATCAITENGLLRILGHPAAPFGLSSPAAARPLLQSLLHAPGHIFWTDDLSLADETAFPALPLSKHLTGLYLLGLAIKHGGRLATFDRHVDASLIPNGPSAYHVLASA